MIASVILDIKNNQCNKTFDYVIPCELEEVTKIGARVFVPFGARKLLGIILEIKNESDYETSKLKKIIELIDYEPILSRELIDLGTYLSKYYFSFLIDNYLMMLPSALKATYKKVLIVKNSSNMSDELKLKLNDRKMVPLEELDSFMDEVIKLKRMDSIEITNIYKQNLHEKTVTVVEILDSTKVKTPRQQQIIDYLNENSGSCLKSVLENDMGYSPSTIKTLEKNGAVRLVLNEVYRDVKLQMKNYQAITLNDEQLSCLNEIRSSYGKFNEFLLHGVCGSGKTEVYLDAIEEVIASGKEAIMLVPEISLTPQMASRFKARFKDKVAIIHSRLSAGEKFDEWRRIKRGEAKIVVGARSAIFVPMNNIGIIIMDEEQEDSYVQDSNPKYDAHHVAVLRAKFHNCPLVLGSATPKVETYYKAKKGMIKLLEINKRANGKPLPSSTIVDMRAELKSGNRSVFSRPLQSALLATISRHEQAVLLINRRGYSTFVMCRSCGKEIKCPHCDTTLTYHRFNERLVCHYCGYETVSPKTCPECGSPYIRFVGDGTQKVEEEIKKILPEARVIRMDSDTVTKKNSHDDIISSFERHEADILLGTQVVAKGLDFPLVSLVGIVNADLGLKMPFYNAYEKTYDLLEQASGRAGRKDTDGMVLVQSYNPENIAIDASAHHDYLKFYESEIKNREIAQNPPFKELIVLVLEGESKATAYKEAMFIVNLIKEKIDDAKILGPTEHYIFKMNDKYRYQITIKLNGINSLEILSYLNERYQAIKDIYLSITRM